MVAGSWSQDCESAASFGRRGTPGSKERGGCRAEAVIRRHAVTKAAQETTNDAAGVAGPGRICFLPRKFAADLRGLTRITQSLF